MIKTVKEKSLRNPICTEMNRVIYFRQNGLGVFVAKDMIWW
jgi:hypothetical protein